MNLTTSKNWVDTHFHVFHAGEAVAGARYVPQYSATLADWMAQAGRVGVRRGVWVQPSFLGVDNRLMLQALEAHPALRGARRGRGGRRHTARGAACFACQRCARPTAELGGCLA